MINLAISEGLTVRVFDYDGNLHYANQLSSGVMLNDYNDFH